MSLGRLRHAHYMLTPRGACEMGPKPPERCTCNGCKTTVKAVTMPEDFRLELATELVVRDYLVGGNR